MIQWEHAATYCFLYIGILECCSFSWMLHNGACPVCCDLYFKLTLLLYLSVCSSSFMTVWFPNNYGFLRFLQYYVCQNLRLNSISAFCHKVCLHNGRSCENPGVPNGRVRAECLLITWTNSLQYLAWFWIHQSVCGQDIPSPAYFFPEMPELEFWGPFINMLWL